MFDMVQIGANISALRKGKGLTQTQLADAMGISFQAVSNWERGQSCPDIAKLSELSQLFDVSVDELLGNERAAVIVKDVQQDKTVEDLQPEEIEELGPILSSEQTRRLAGQCKQMDLKGLTGIAPFEDRSYVDELLLKAVQSGETKDLHKLAGLAPFAGKEALDEAVSCILEATGDLSGITGLAPFLSKKTLGSIVDRALQGGCSSKKLLSLLPFLPKEKTDSIAKTIFENEGLDAVIPYAPFLDAQTLSAFVEAAGDDGKTHVGLAPFLKREAVDAMAQKAFAKRGVHGMVALAPFMSRETLEQIAEQIKSSGSYKDLLPLLPFLE